MIVPSSRGVLLFVAALAAGPGCKKREKAAASAPAPPPTEGVAEPLPAGATDGAIGIDGATGLLAAADDGAWVMLCQREGTAQAKLHVVVGDGPGLVADRAVAASERDLVVVDGASLIHVDVVARTWRRLGPAAPIAIHAASRRLIQVDGSKLIVRDPGVAPRTIDHGVEIAGLWSRSKRWLEVADGTPNQYLRQGHCHLVDTGAFQYGASARTTVDLDPSGLEALDRIGPELGISAGGEVTLDGAVVVGADCVASVIAALAEPPRALVMCNRGGNRVVGPGVDKVVRGTLAGQREQATIAEQLTLGTRVICVSGACIDLITGRDFETYGQDLVWLNDRLLVRKDKSGLLLDDLDQERQRTLALPRISQAVTVDTATGRRTAGAAPKPPAFIDGAGRFLLYGRHVIDVDAGVLVATLAEDAIAIDSAGRVLVPASDGYGPLRWRRP